MRRNSCRFANDKDVPLFEPFIQPERRIVMISFLAFARFDCSSLLRRITLEQGFVRLNKKWWELQTFPPFVEPAEICRLQPPAITGRLYSAGKNQYQNNYDNQTQTAAWVISPGAAVRPSR